MSKRQVVYVDCDRCCAQAVANPVSVRLNVGYLHCPAGGRGEEDYEDIDLCGKCAAAMLSQAVSGLDYAASKAWVESVWAHRKAQEK